MQVFGEVQCKQPYKLKPQLTQLFDAFKKYRLEQVTHELVRPSHTSHPVTRHFEH